MWRLRNQVLAKTRTIYLTHARPCYSALLHPPSYKRVSILDIWTTMGFPNSVRMYEQMSLTTATAFTPTNKHISICRLLTILSAASFIPQFHRILSRRSCEGLSPSSILQNLIAATSQFSQGLAFVLIRFCLGYPVPPDETIVEQWLNLAQFSVVLLGHLIL